MRVLSKKALKQFWSAHHRAQAPLQAWYDIVCAADWKSPSDIKNQFGSNIDFVADNRVIFDIGGNKYRLVAHIGYLNGIVYIKFVGTHAEYDDIDPEVV